MLTKLLKSIPGAWQLYEKLLPHKFVSRTEGEQFGLFNEQTRELIGGFAIGPDDTVVDAGCGAGYASTFASACGAAVYAVDVDANALSAIKERMRRQNPPRPFQTLLSDVNPLPLPDGLASRVVAQEVLEHVDDPHRFLGELVRVGRPGALYLLSVPDPVSESVQERLAPEAYWRKPNHLRIFQREEFADLVRDSGLIIEKRLSYSFFWSMWWFLFWSVEGEVVPGAPGTPVLAYWNKTWAALMRTPNGARIKQALDGTMPKSQVILASKAA